MEDHIFNHKFVLQLIEFTFVFTQIGYSTSSPLFSDKEKFPLYFRTSTSETMENPSRVALLKQFNWKKVALLVQNLDIYVLVRCVNRFSGVRSCASVRLTEGVIWKHCYCDCHWKDRDQGNDSRSFIIRFTREQNDCSVIVA